MYSGCGLSLDVTRVPQEDYKVSTWERLFSKQVNNLHQLEFIRLLEAYKCLENKFKMPKVAKTSNLVETTSDNEYQTDSNLSNESSSDVQEIFFNPQPSTSNNIQEVPCMDMYMPYTEGPFMDWSVNDNLYNRFLKWKLKCKNIIECELAM